MGLFFSWLLGDAFVIPREYCNALSVTRRRAPHGGLPLHGTTACGRVGRPAAGSPGPDVG
jgi:hypothetical protein